MLFCLLLTQNELLVLCYKILLVFKFRYTLMELGQFNGHVMNTVCKLLVAAIIFPNPSPPTKNHPRDNVLGRANAWSENADPEGRQANLVSAFAERNKKRSIFESISIHKLRRPKGRLNLWVKMDSNHRSRKTADLQSAPFGHSGIHPALNPSGNYLLVRRVIYFSIS